MPQPITHGLPGMSRDIEDGDDGVDTDYIELLEQIEKFLIVIVLGLLILFGVFGNITSMIVMQTKHFKRFRSMVVLCALAIADVGVLLSSALFLWVTVVTDYEVDYSQNSSGSCKVVMFTGDFFLLLSAWTLVQVTVERAIAVSWPQKVHIWCSKKRMIAAWCTILALLFILDLYLLILYDLQDFNEGDPQRNESDIHCEFPLEDVEVLSGVQFQIGLWVGSIIPWVCIVVFNGIIIYKLRKKPTGEAEVLAEGGARKGRSVTIMLVVVSSIFIVCTLPLRLMAVFQDDWFPEWETDPVVDAEMKLTTACLAILYFTNNAINFALYVAAGSQFRKAAGELFCPCCCKKTSGDINNMEAESVSYSVDKTYVDETEDTPRGETYTTFSDHL